MSKPSPEEIYKKFSELSKDDKDTPITIIAALLHKLKQDSHNESAARTFYKIISELDDNSLMLIKVSIPYLEVKNNEVDARDNAVESINFEENVRKAIHLPDPKIAKHLYNAVKFGEETKKQNAHGKFFFGVVDKLDDVRLQNVKSIIERAENNPHNVEAIKRLEFEQRRREKSLNIEENPLLDFVLYKADNDEIHRFELHDFPKTLERLNKGNQNFDNLLPEYLDDYFYHLRDSRKLGAEESAKRIQKICDILRDNYNTKITFTKNGNDLDFDPPEPNPVPQESQTLQQDKSTSKAL